MLDPFDLVGDVLDGEFRVEELVGEGALSVVYRAQNVTMGVSACVKCLNLPSTFGPEATESVVASFEAGCKLHYRLARGHIAIAQTFTTGTTLAPRTGAQVHYLVREWLEGESLAKNLARRREEKQTGRRLPEVVEMLAPIAAALTYAHAQGAEHLSIMPSNVFLDKKGIKLLDFGVGRVVDDVASTRSPMAKNPPRIKLLLPTYAAPEQIDTTLGPTGPWTDVYALALVILEVLSDKPVMHEKDSGAICKRALSPTGRPCPKDHGVLLPPRADAALTQALALEPESRQASVAELWEELAGSLTKALPPKTRGRMSRHLRRVRRIKGSIRPPSLRPPPMDFGDDEAPTNRVPIATALLAASALRSSVRPPPAPSHAPPAPKPTTPPAPVAKPRTVPLPPKPKAPLPPPEPTVPSADVVPIPSSAFPSVAQPPVAANEPPPPPAELMAVLQQVEASPVKPPPKAPPAKPAKPATEPLKVETMHAFPPPPARGDEIVPAPAKVEAAPPPPPEPALVMERPPEMESPLSPPKSKLQTVLEVPLAKGRQLYATLKPRVLSLDRRVLAAAAAFVVALLLSGTAVLAAALLHKSPPDKPVASASAAPPLLPATHSAKPIDSTPPVETTAPEPSATAPVHPGKFNQRLAAKAIHEAVADLSSCSKKHGVWGKGQVGVIFNNDGTVRKVLLATPFTGDVGECIRKAVEQVQIDPFVGVVGATYVYFVVPYTP